MLKKIQLAIFLGCMGAMAHAINPDQEYIDFLKRYERFENTHDPQGLELYDDEAKIISNSTDADGTEYTTIVRGKRYKEIAMENLEQLKKVGTQITYTNIRIKRNNDSTKILADKYGNLKCFTDKDYYMVVSRKPDNKLYIIEENSTFSKQSLCKDGIKDDLALQLSVGASMVKKNLPIQIDPETSFDYVEAKDKTLRMVYRMIHFSMDELNMLAIEQIVIPELINGVCNNKAFAEMLDKGATFEINYIDRNKQLITEVHVNKKDCGH